MPALNMFFTLPPSLSLSLSLSDPCDPNPCLNGAQCLLGGTPFTCSCPVGFTGPLCASPSPPVCPDSLCDSVFRPSITVRRLDKGDRVFLSSANSSYCSSIHGFCTGGSVVCGSCQCEFGTTYAQNTGMCENFIEGERQMDRCRQMDRQNGEKDTYFHF